MKRKSFVEMTVEELAAATERFDEPFVADKSRPLTPEGREQWKRLKRKSVGPTHSRGPRRISVSLDPELLARVTALAKARRISRSKLFAEALDEVVSREENPTG